MNKPPLENPELLPVRDYSPASDFPDLGNAHYRDPSTIAAVVALADKVPLLRVNLNNYKYHGNPVFCGGAPGEWDENGIGRVVVHRQGPDDWRMWYDGFCRDGSMKVGYATSKDGIRWEKYRDNPVLEATDEWEGSQVSATSVTFVNGLFYLYYWGPGHVIPARIKRIGLAVSEDGIHWEKRGIVLDADPQILDESPASGGTGLDAGKAFYLRQEARWYMIFTGFGASGNWNGLAESADGIHWKKVKAPILAVRGPHNSVGNGHERWGTLRCPIQIGSLWAGFATGIGGGWAPAAALTLDEWVALGVSSMPSKQDYEEGMVHAPWSIEVADGSYYIYHTINGRSPVIGLIRAPMHSIHQPILLWEKEPITARTESMILEPDGRAFTLHLTSDQPGEARIMVWNPAGKAWMEMDGVSVGAGRLCTMATPDHSRVRLTFVPGQAPCVVSAWAIPEQ